MVHLKAGRHDALAVLLDRYHRLVWSIAHRVLHDEGEAEDMVQSVFLEIFQKVELFDRSRGTLKVWLLQFAYVRSLNRLYHLQRRHFYNQTDVEDVTALQFAPAKSMFLMSSSETARLVREILETLDEKQRTAVELISFEGLTLEELATRTGETTANAKHHYYRGMAKLRECLGSPEWEPEKGRPRVTGRQRGSDVRAQ